MTHTHQYRRSTCRRKRSGNPVRTCNRSSRLNWQQTAASCQLQAFVHQLGQPPEEEQQRLLLLLVVTTQRSSYWEAGSMFWATPRCKIRTSVHSPVGCPSSDLDGQRRVLWYTARHVRQARGQQRYGGGVWHRHSNRSFAHTHGGHRPSSGACCLALWARRSAGVG
jgi:hypothetical protein